MSHCTPPGRTVEGAFVALSVLTLASIVFSNVIRIAISETFATWVWATLSVLSWLAAIGWGLRARSRSTVTWLAVLFASGILIAVCQHFAGGVSTLMMLQLLGSAGAGLGLALLLKSSLRSNGLPWIAAAAALCGSVAAVWMALEPGLELWKILPNNWEISKNLEYRWGIRMGQDRARFIFDAPMEAGVAQWFLGTICLATALSRKLVTSTRWIFGILALSLYGTVALTYSRAGMALGALSLGLAGLYAIRTKRATVITSLLAFALVFVAVLASKSLGNSDSAGVRNVTSILDPGEEANRIRITQFAEIGSFLSQTPWHGKGPDTYATFKQAPRMPEHESFPAGIISAFGVGGGLLILVFGWLIGSNVKRLVEVILSKRFSDFGTSDRLTIMAAPPFALYGLLAPILASLLFGIVWFTIMGLLVLWEPTLGESTGKP